MLSRKVLAISMLFVLLISAFVMRPDELIREKAEAKTPTRPHSFVNVSADVGLEGVKGDNLAWGDYNNDGNIPPRGPAFEHRPPPPCPLKED